MNLYVNLYKIMRKLKKMQLILKNSCNHNLSCYNYIVTFDFENNLIYLLYIVEY